MVFEPNFTKVVSSVRTSVGITQSVIELKLPTNENDISKVFSVGAKSTITNAESNGKDITFMGLVDFQAIYDSDGMTAVDYSAEFKDKFQADDVVDGELVLESNVVDVSSSVTAGGIKVVAIIEVTIDKIVSRELDVLTSVDGDDAHISSKDLVYNTYLGRAYEKFDVTGEMQIDSVTAVLMVTPSVSLTLVEPRENYIAVSGKLNVDICYKTGDNPNDIATKYHSIDFSWEVALEGVDESSIVQSIVNIVYNEIKVTTEISEGSAVVSLYVPVAYSGYVFNQNNIEVVEDVYLEKNYMSITCENFDTTIGCPSVCFKDNISGVASISDTAPFIDEILGVCTNNLVLASSRVEEDRLSIEGVANATVVYYTKETGDITSVQVEMPFSVEEKVSGKNSGVVTVTLDNISARSKRGKEIEVSAELSVYTDMYNLASSTAITAVTVGEEKPQDDCALYIYIVKPNQTIWDVAKDLNTSQELILEQNPEVELPLKAQDKLVVYTPTMIKY